MADDERKPDNEFTVLGLDPRLVETLLALGYEEPTPIQRAAIPALLTGRDLMGQAATGTGKTAAFALPLLHRLAALGRERSRPSALILVPTRELAVQVAEAVHRYGRQLEGSVIPLYGGQSFGQQARALARGIDVVVATPGRAIDHIKRGTISLAGVSVVVLDEADEMLDMGFAEDIQTILAETPRERQTMLFSVSLPPPIMAIARRHLVDPVEITVPRERVAAGAAPRVRQSAYIVDRAHKLTALGRLLDVEDPTSALVFCRTRIEVDEVAETLAARGYRAEALHGGMAQDERERVMGRLRAGAADLIIATDVAARGLDIEQLSHVFNYDVPSNPEAYVHRIGRVGRAGRAGIVVTLAEPREVRMLRNIEHATKHKIQIDRLPTIADLRAHRLEMTRAALNEVLVEDDFEDVGVVVEALLYEFDLMQIALAAVKLAHRAESREGQEDADEIPAPVAPRPRPPRAGAPARGERRSYGEHGKREYGQPSESTRRTQRDSSAAEPWQQKERAPDSKRAAAPGNRRDRASAAHQERGAHASRPADRPSGPSDRPRKPRPAGDGAGMVRLLLNVGRRAGVRPQDLVGAITGEAGVIGRAIGAIDISDESSLVEVAEEIAAQVVRAMRGVRIKGVRISVRQL
jgi:ATP-dependent RNA helicase DeaD